MSSLESSFLMIWKIRSGTPLRSRDEYDRSYESLGTTSSLCGEGDVLVVAVVAGEIGAGLAYFEPLVKVE